MLNTQLIKSKKPSELNMFASRIKKTIEGNSSFKKAKRTKKERKLDLKKAEEGGFATKRVGPIIHTPLASLQPFPNNPKHHSEEQVLKLAAIIKSYKIITPITADENGTILSGHGRLLAAKHLKLKTLPVVTVSGLTEDQKRGYVLADNKVAEMSTWNDTALKAQLEALYRSEFNLDMTGFTTPEFEKIVLNEGVPCTTPPASGDLAPEDLIEKPVTTLRGDLYQLGKHFLLCGDALSRSSYIRLMQEMAAEMVITDPPYNVPIHGHVCGKGKSQHGNFLMASGEMSSPQFLDFLTNAFIHMKEFTIKNAVLFSFMDWRHIDEIQTAGRKIFGGLAQLCVWVKSNGGMGTFYRSKHELVFVFRKGASGHINNFQLGQTGRYRTNVWEYPSITCIKEKGRKLLELHPTVKPVSMIMDAIRDCSDAGGLVLDPFSGSGTTIIAAQLTRRCARAIELDEGYCDIAIRRWERITGEEAIHVESGLTFSELSKQRTKHTGE